MQEMFHVEQFFNEQFKNLDFDIFKANIERYYSKYLEWNKKINVSRIVDRADFWIKHVLDSLILASYLKREKFEYLVDIGTGGGFPGIVLAMAFKKQMFLVDKVNKKLKFINECLTGVNLNSKVQLLHKNFTEGDFIKSLNMNIKDAVFIARAVNIESLLPLLYKNSNLKLFLMTTESRFNEVLNKHKQEIYSKSIHYEQVKYTEFFGQYLWLPTYFEYYVLVKMFHVKQL